MIGLNKLHAECVALCAVVCQMFINDQTQTQSSCYRWSDFINSVVSNVSCTSSW